ncbi:unnamed protein product [Alopecurus aequalis]
MMQPPVEKRAPMDAGDSDMCLPYDVLLDILRRLPCRAVAQSRTICRAWRALIDDHGLLPRFFSARSFPGVFTNHTGCQDSVEDHCNGLLLLHNSNVPLYGGNEETHSYVCNPATVRCDPLPRPRSPWALDRSEEGTFLAFDPAVSLHYEVYKLFRCDKTYWNEMMFSCDEPYWKKKKKRRCEEPETPVVYACVFSSETKRWKMRQFMPGRCAPEHLHAVKASACDMNSRSAEYWCGSLYVVGHNGVLTILRCFEGTYDLVQLPGDVYTSAGGTYHLPRRSLLSSYKKGVHYAELNAFRLRVWALTGGLGDDGQLGWMLVNDANIEPYIPSVLVKSRATQPTMAWEMATSSKSNSLFRQENDTADGAYDEEVEEQQDTDVDGENNDMYEEQGSAAAGDLDYYSWSSDEDNFIEADNKTTNNKTSLKWIRFNKCNFG